MVKCPGTLGPSCPWNVPEPLNLTNLDAKFDFTGFHTVWIELNDLLSVIDIVVNLPYLTVCDDTKVIDHGTDWGHNNLMIIELLNNIIYYYLSTQFKLDRSRVSLNLKFS